MTAAAVVGKAAASLLSNEKTRKGLGWLLAVIFSPLILLIALLCSVGTGTADHNNKTVEASFYGTQFTEKIPAVYREHVEDMQTAFSRLDAAVAQVNANTENGNGVDLLLVKSVFMALCFGEETPSRREARRFVKCFYVTETRTRTVIAYDQEGNASVSTETYTVNVPLPLAEAYANVAIEVGRAITDEDKENVQHIYLMIAGGSRDESGTVSLGNDGAAGTSYSRGNGGGSVELDGLALSDPSQKNAADLVAYARNAYEQKWGYVWGTFGGVLSDGAFDSKLAQYPDALTSQADFIRSNWVGGRTTDCVGLIKGYGWLDAESDDIVYGSNGMPDVTANEMYHNATTSGTIDTIPETPGLAVWHNGHIGVYIGNGEVIEAMGTKYGVVKTKLEGSRWTNWLEIPYISYD